jgi:hypothetical protein
MLCVGLNSANPSHKGPPAPKKGLQPTASSVLSGAAPVVFHIVARWQACNHSSPSHPVTSAGETAGDTAH